jgi:hypothetical protein
MERQQLLMEYRTQLDTHALGITAVQVFLEMMLQPSSLAAASSVPGEVWVLKRAWEQYWKDAYRWWEPLYNAFEKKTDWNTIRQSYITNEVHNIIDKDLGHLRLALSRLCDVCANAEPGSQLSGAGHIFLAMNELISQGGKPLNHEACLGGVRLASWSNVRSILGLWSPSTTHPAPRLISRRPSESRMVRNTTPTRRPMMTSKCPYVAASMFAPHIVAPSRPAFASFSPAIRVS